jgi:hypothetical protein
MSSTCRACRRKNPPEAQYCYFDGVPLDGVDTRGPIAAGARAFATPFVLPSGHSCRSFDELVLACEADWDGARSLLQQGYLEGFFGAMGRADLAVAARQAASGPDLDRGLDALLGKLPSTVRDPVKLEVAQREIDLGEMPAGSDKRLTLDLKNAGMGLVQGTVSCAETAWLAVGEAPAGPQKMVQFRQDLALPVHVVGKALRANVKPIAGKLLVETNGGVFEIPVRVRVPVKPFPVGVLAGAETPRRIAEKAKAAPKEAAVLFASGAVAAWYESNGWTYPVQGPSATGLGAVQQFFEALGLVAAPKVTITTENVFFRGAPGAYLEQIIQVQTIEKRPVYAHAVSKSAWLQIGKIQLKGQTANIPVLIPSVPSMPGEELQSRVEVAANGNQHFTVSVFLAITDEAGHAFRVAPPPLVPGLSEAGHSTGGAEAVMPDVTPSLPSLGPPPLPGQRPPLPPDGAGHVNGASPLVQPAAQTGGLTSAHGDISPSAPTRPTSPFDFRNMVDVEPVPAAGWGRRGAGPPADGGAPGGVVKHLLPLLLLLLGLGCMLFHDYRLEDRSAVVEDVADLPVDPQPYLALRFHEGQAAEMPSALAEVLATPTMRFGLVMEREAAPGFVGGGAVALNKEKKRLTFSELGISNNTVIRVGREDFLFGGTTNKGVPSRGAWVKRDEPAGRDAKDREVDGRVSTWRLNGPKVLVTQRVEIVASEAPPGEKTRRLDTCLIRYELKNEDSVEHQVGLRFLLDTFIGARDGVPFTIPGRPDLCDTREEFRNPSEVPDFIQVLEKDDPRDPGTVARVQFRVGKQIEPPSRVYLGGWPNALWKRETHPNANGPLTMWDVPHLSMRPHEIKQAGARPIHIDADSAVTLYWDPKPLGPGETRKVGFAYGLGSVAGQESEGRLLLTAGGRMAVNAEFTLTALVPKPLPDESLTLNLPPGLAVKPEDEKQSVPPVPKNATRQVSTVTWKIRASTAGEHKVRVTSSRGAQQTITIQIRQRGVFD